MPLGSCDMQGVPAPSRRNATQAKSAARIRALDCPIIRSFHIWPAFDLDLIEIGTTSSTPSRRDHRQDIVPVIDRVCYCFSVRIKATTAEAWSSERLVTGFILPAPFLMTSFRSSSDFA